MCKVSNNFIEVWNLKICYDGNVIPIFPSTNADIKSRTNKIYPKSCVLYGDMQVFVASWLPLPLWGAESREKPAKIPFCSRRRSCRVHFFTLSYSANRKNIGRSKPSPPSRCGKGVAYEYFYAVRKPFSSATRRTLGEFYGSKRWTGGKNRNTAILISINSMN